MGGAVKKTGRANVSDEGYLALGQRNEPAVDRAVGVPARGQQAVAGAAQLAIGQFDDLARRGDEVHVHPAGRGHRGQDSSQVGTLSGPARVSFHRVEIAADQPAGCFPADHGQAIELVPAEPPPQLRLVGALSLIPLPGVAGRHLRAHFDRDDRSATTMILQDSLQ
jgi:hypothetical protein